MYLKLYKASLNDSAEISNLFSLEQKRFTGGSTKQVSSSGSSSTQQAKPIKSSTITDYLPPGIKINFGNKDRLFVGEQFSAYVADEGKGYTEGSNPTDTIGRLNCTIGGTNSYITSTKELPPVRSGITFTESNPNERIFLPIRSNLNQWTIEATIKLTLPLIAKRIYNKDKILKAQVVAGGGTGGTSGRTGKKPGGTEFNGGGSAAFGGGFGGNALGAFGLGGNAGNNFGNDEGGFDLSGGDGFDNGGGSVNQGGSGGGNQGGGGKQGGGGENTTRGNKSERRT